MCKDKPYNRVYFINITIWVKLEFMRNTQSGNVLFIILIAVALLAGLSYAVTQSNRGGGSGFSSQKADLYASEIMGYGNIVSQAVSQIRLRGYSDTEISMENSEVSGYANPNCAIDECKIFNLSGGGISYQAPKSDWLDSSQSSNVHYGELYFHGEASVVGVGTDSDDLIMFIPYVKQEICIAINKALNISPLNVPTPLETNGPFYSNMKFTGSYGSSNDVTVSGDGTVGEQTILNGKSTGCTQSSGGGAIPSVGSYHYFQVLIAR